MNVKAIPSFTIRIDDRADRPDFQVARGTVVSVSGDNFTLTVEHAHHFTPTAGDITVQTDLNTAFRRARGVSATLADVSADATVLVGGTFDEATQTLNAKFVHLR